MFCRKDRNLPQFKTTDNGIIPLLIAINFNTVFISKIQGICWKQGMLPKCLLSVKGRPCYQTPLVN